MSKSGTITIDDFEHLYEQFGPMVLRRCRALLKDEEKALDAMQDVFVKVLEVGSAFRGESSPWTWLYRITTTRALDLLRSRKSKKRFGFMQRLTGEDNEPLYELADFNHPGVTLDRKENAAKLFKAIAQLPENQKTAFTLHKLEDLSYQEVSEVMQTSIAAVESLMHRAKQNLRKMLEKESG